MEKENKTIYRPKAGTDAPDAQRYNPETGEPVQVDKRAALKQWFRESKKDNRKDNESYQVTIDPKQAFYARKKGKDNE